MYLLQLADKVKEGLAALGLLEMRFNTIGVSDGISKGTEGMSFSFSHATSLRTPSKPSWQRSGATETYPFQAATRTCRDASSPGAAPTAHL